MGRVGVAESLVISWLPEPENHPLWPDIYRMLEPAAKVGNCPVLEDNDLVWIAIKGKTIVGAHTCRLLTDGPLEMVHTAGTGFREWFGPMEEALTDFARDCGAEKMISRGRKGWSRVNAPYGWKTVGEEDGLLLFEKEL